MYVSDLLKSVVYRYPLVNGVAASEPDGILNVQPAPGSTSDVSAYGLAFDSGGNMYVSSVSSKGAQIDVYAPGAVGNDVPLRILNLPFIRAALGVAIDSQDYLYLTDDRGIDIYAPGASGHDKPVNNIGNKAFRPLNIAAVTESNQTKIYVVGNGHVAAYGRHDTKWVSEQHICFRGGISNEVGAAVDQTNGFLFISKDGRPGGVIVVPQNYKKCPAPRVLRRVYVVSPDQRLGFGPMGIAYFNGYIFVADGRNFVTYQVAASSRGQTAPVATMNGGVGYGVAIGP